jgi:hydroxypyruvate isomerase
MNQIKQSVAWWCFVPQKLTAEALIESAQKIGYRALELVDEPYWPLVRDAGLNIASTRGHGTIEQGLNQREHRARIVQEIQENLALAVKWQIPNLICFSGSRSGMSDALGAEITAETLSVVAPMAEAAGVTLVLELLNSKVDHPDYQCDHTAWGVNVCKMVNSPQVKLLYDIYHMQIMEGDVIRTIQQDHQYIGHYHTAGNPGRHEIDESQELNYSAIMRAILATGYNGYVGQEFIPEQGAVESLQKAFTICDLAS